MINNNYNRSVNSFGMVEYIELDMVGGSLNTSVHQSVLYLSISPVFIYDI